MKNLLLSSLLFSILLTSVAQEPGVLWGKKIQPFSYNTGGQIIYAVSRTNNGDFILVGSDTTYYLNKNQSLDKETGGRPLIIKTDSIGNTIWTGIGDGYSSFYNSVVQSTTSNFVAAGSISDYRYPSTYQQDFLVSEYEDNGVPTWNKNFGGANFEFAQGLVQSGDGGYVVAGYTNSNDTKVTDNHGLGTYDFWVIKLDGSGNLLWQKCFGGTKDDKAYTIQKTSDGGYIVAGTAMSSDGNVTASNGAQDGWIIKLDNSGNLQWEKSIGGTSNDVFKSILQNIDGTYILTGFTYSNDQDVTGNHGNADVWVVKIDASGNIVWQKCLGGSSEEFGSSLEKTIDGAYLISGHTQSKDGDVKYLNGDSDTWIVKIDDNGKLIWEKTIGTNKNEYGAAIKAISQNRFVLVGNEIPPFATSFPQAYLYELGNSSSIKGTVFMDYNKNGNKELEEPFFSNIIVKSEKPNYSRSAIPYNGSFKIDVDTGTYKTSAVYHNPYYTVVPASATSVFSSYFNSDSLSFAVQQMPNKRDLSINLAELMPARPGFQTSYKIFYKNQGTDTIASGTVQFVKSNKLSIVSTDPAYNSIKGDTLKWNYSNLKPEDTASITLVMKVDAPPSVAIGDTLTSVATISPAAKDETPFDDTARLVQRVVGSFDPNDKTEKNGGTITPAQVAKGDYLLYTVRFQNTGTDTAFNIAIRDTLDSKADWNTLEMVSSSHNYQLTIKEGNKLTWSFNNINLPDSNVNEAASHGYVVYRIKPNASLLPGDTISNTASIYFDFNLPVQTNTEKTVVESALLPIKLSGFTARRNGKQNEIEWNISKDLNIAAFEVEKSGTGRDFAKIGTIKATNNTKYYLNDALPLKAINYYRLKLLYRDGAFEYSQVKSVNNSGSFDVSIYPNPVKNNLGIRINSEKKTDISMKITGMDGKVIQTITYLAPAGTVIKNINVNSLSKGTYFLLLSSSDEQAGIKFEKL